MINKPHTWLWRRFTLHSDSMPSSHKVQQVPESNSRLFFINNDGLDIGLRKYILNHVSSPGQVIYNN